MIYYLLINAWVSKSPCFDCGPTHLQWKFSFTFSHGKLPNCNTKSISYFPVSRPCNGERSAEVPENFLAAFPEKGQQGELQLGYRRSSLGNIRRTLRGRVVAPSRAVCRLIHVPDRSEGWAPRTEIQVSAVSAIPYGYLILWTLFHSVFLLNCELQLVWVNAKLGFWASQSDTPYFSVPENNTVPLDL